MANLVKFDMKKVPAALSEMYVRITDLNRNELYAGTVPAVNEIDLGTVGTVGQGVLIHADNYAQGNESTFMAIDGYSEIIGSALTKQYDKVVFIGASIIQAMFGNDLTTPHSVATQALVDSGITGVEVYGAGIGGHFARDIAARIPSILEAFPSNTLFVAVAGGNNTTASRPFNPSDNGTLSNHNEWPAIIEAFSGREDDVIYGNISFRSYGATGELAADDYIENEYGGSNLYNTNYLNDLIIQQGGLSTLNGSILIDMYNQFRNKYKTWLGGDGVHETSIGREETRLWLYDRIGFILSKDKSEPSPITPASFPSWTDPTNTNPERVDINFGGSSPVQNNILISELASSSNIALLKPDGTDSGISISGDSTVGSLVAEGNSGVACNRPNSTALFSDQCTYKYFYFKSSGAFTVTLSGLQPSINYMVSYLNGKGSPMIATANGVDLNLPEANLANIGKTTLEANDQGEIKIDFSGNAYSHYICGLTIEPLN